uniref:SFRICE_009223 n=1 Tax=Spodoptera frugiperda TaxID=7108 RepID=A0A2H1WT10_SPOFR
MLRHSWAIHLNLLYMPMCVNPSLLVGDISMAQSTSCLMTVILRMQHHHKQTKYQRLQE